MCGSVKRGLSYGKRDLLYGKRDLLYGKRDLLYGKRGLLTVAYLRSACMRKCRKRPIVWQKRPIMWQKSPIDISILEVCIRVNEAYYSCKSDLVLWQKRPSKGKRGLLFTHTTHTHTLSLSYLPSLAPPFSLRSRKHQRYRGSSQPRARQRGLEEGGGRGEGGGRAHKWSCDKLCG